MDQRELLEIIATRAILDTAIQIRKEKNKDLIDKSLEEAEDISIPNLDDYIDEAKQQLDSWRKYIFSEEK